MSIFSEIRIYIARGGKKRKLWEGHRQNQKN